MEAPDKIYAGTITEGMGISKVWRSNPEHLENPVEFIRKDALIEWLKERICDGDEEGLMTNQIANLAYKDVINKINSL